jgi:hypothetical protein
MHKPTLGVLAVLISLATACSSPGAGPGTAAPAAAPVAARGFPGFDTALYPGDDAMRTWRTASPYRWVGYYLPAPCHRDASWSGKRATLEAMGWGTAVIYVGQQAWEGVPDREPADSAAASRPIICSRTLLTDSTGRRDADDAIARASADGFPRGSVIFLDIEPVSTVSDALRSYYRAWTRRVAQDGRYRPGLYAHRRNSADILGDMRGVLVDAGAQVASSPFDIPLWLAAPSSEFSLVQAPGESGAGAVSIWQGRLTFDEAWAGVKLRIDANVADSPSPSAPRSGP